MQKRTYLQYKEIILYTFFGVCTTVLNIVIYYYCYKYLFLNNIVSNFIAWTLAIMFAFITNKIWVFESHSRNIKTIFSEAGTFLSCRIITGGLDMVIMYAGVDIMGGEGVTIKLLSNILVIILNYLASKLIIFKTK